MGSVEGRRNVGLQEPPDGKYAWVVVNSEMRRVEWCTGEVIDGKTMSRNNSKMEVENWHSVTWKSGNQTPLHLGGKEYTGFGGEQILTSMTMNGVQLHRAFAVTVGDNEPIYVLLSEAKALGWEEICLGAVIMEYRKMRSVSKFVSWKPVNGEKLQISQDTPINTEPNVIQPEKPISPEVSIDPTSSLFAIAATSSSRLVKHPAVGRVWSDYVEGPGSEDHKGIDEKEAALIARNSSVIMMSEPDKLVSKVTTDELAMQVEEASQREQEQARKPRRR